MSTIQKSNAVSDDLLTAMNPAKAGEKSRVEEVQDRFMKLLVTQMRNQDPLNPLDNAQVTGQLAQLSTVTGIDKLNTTLESLMASFQASQTLQASAMIGRGVMAPGSHIHLTDAKALFGVELAGPADKVSITIKDGAGNAVRTIEWESKDAGTYPLAWDGAKDGGGVAPDGKYTFEVNATRDGKKIDGARTLAFGEVGSVSTGVQGMKLHVIGLGEISMADVKQIL